MTELGLYIDIEGFAEKFDNGAKQSFINLTNDLFRLGQTDFKHLSIIQFGGDGFHIKEVLTYTNDLNRFIDIATALLISIALRGGMGRVHISHGRMADITGLFTDEIQNQIRNNNSNILGTYQNVMLINPVIGTSIINCYKLKGPKGPLLLIDKLLAVNFPKEDLIHYSNNGHDVYGINWLKRKNDSINRLLSALKLDNSSLIKKFENYLTENKLPDEWKKEAQNLLEYN